jgi:hypothetical protein
MKHIKPLIGSVWMHRNGINYQVLLFTNVGGSKANYQEQIVYTNIHNGLVYSRPLSDWHRSMTLKWYE